MKEKFKLFWEEWAIPILGSTAFVAGLFLFCAVLCMIFGGR